MSKTDIQAIIFDLDGTLVDSAEDLRAALNIFLGELGLRPVEPAEVKGMIGDGVAKLVERGLTATGGDPGKVALLPRFMEIYQADAATRTRPYPGAGETLAALQQRGFRLALVTNKPLVAARQILEQLGLAEFLPVVIGGDSLPHRKPHPAPLLEAARQLGVDPTRSLMVGDNIHDVEAAKAAGIRCIAVTYGYHHRPPAEFGADHLIDRLDELPALLGGPLTSAAENGSAA